MSFHLVEEHQLPPSYCHQMALEPCFVVLGSTADRQVLVDNAVDDHDHRVSWDNLEDEVEAPLLSFSMAGPLKRILFVFLHLRIFPLMCFQNQTCLFYSHPYQYTSLWNHLKNSIEYQAVAERNLLQVHENRFFLIVLLYAPVVGPQSLEVVNEGRSLLSIHLDTWDFYRVAIERLQLLQVPLVYLNAMLVAIAHSNLHLPSNLFQPYGQLLDPIYPFHREILTMMACP
mmetsp:Transcript_58/g.118  ORF Transcript_58/g.118 Transcript_58/m.118 type:complete len:229 (+) Transcript_58:981-1667(+)